MLTDDEIQAHADRIRDDGYTVIEHAANHELVDGRTHALELLGRERGKRMVWEATDVKKARTAGQ